MNQNKVTKTKAIMIVTSIALISFLQAAQAGWVRTYEEIWGVSDFEITQDGGYVLIGNATNQDTSDTSVRFYVIKTDTQGNKIWEKGHPWKPYIQVHSIKETSDKAYLISAIIQSFDSTDGRWLIKLSAQGDTVWSRFFSDGYVFQVAETKDSNYVATGQCFDSNMGKLWLVKLDPQGNTIWEKSLCNGDSTINNGYSLSPTNDGGCIVGGRSDLMFPENPDSEDNAWLLKFDENGDTVWTKTYGHEDFRTTGWGIMSVIQTEDEAYAFIAHKDHGEYHDNDIWLVKTDPAGDTVWTRTFGNDAESDFDEGYCLQQTPDGGYVIVGATALEGSTDISAWLIKTDSEGDSLWAKTYGWSSWDEAYKVRQTFDGGYVLGGCINRDSDPSSYGLLIKTDSLGYTDISEPATPPPPSNLALLSSVGSEIVLRYEGMPGGFRASVFDACGRRVDELHSNMTQGTIQWGTQMSPGVYFIKTEGERQFIRKVVLVR